MTPNNNEEHWKNSAWKDSCVAVFFLLCQCTQEQRLMGTMRWSFRIVVIKMNGKFYSNAPNPAWCWPEEKVTQYDFTKLQRCCSNNTFRYATFVCPLIWKQLKMFLSNLSEFIPFLSFLAAMMRWWPWVGQAMRWLQLGTEKRPSGETEKEEWAGASGAAGKVSSQLHCSMALWPYSPLSCTMCSCCTMWRHLFPSTRLTKSPSGWERWVRRNLSGSETCISNSLLISYHKTLFVDFMLFYCFLSLFLQTVFLIWNSLNDPLFGWLSDRAFLSSPQ